MSVVTPIARWRAATLAIAGTLPWLLAYPLYQAGAVLVAQAGPLRALGVAAVFAAGGWAGAAALAAAAVAAGLDRRPLVRRLAGDAAYAAAGLALGTLGLAVFHKTVGAAPLAWKVGAAAFVVVLLGSYLRNPPASRRLARLAMRGIGAAVLALPVAGTPLIAWGAATDRPRLPTAIAPAAGPVRPTAPRRILLVTFDTLSADHVAYDGGFPTPHLAAFAREADRSDRCVAAGDQTRVSMPVVLSGLRPPAIFPHLPNDYGFFRAGSITGLAGHLRAAGYRTSAVTTLIGPSQFGMAGEYDHVWAANTVFEPNLLNPPAFLPLAETAAWLDGRFLRRREGRFFDPETFVGGLPNNVRIFRDAAKIAGAGGRAFVWVHSLAPHPPLLDLPPAELDAPVRGKAYRRVSTWELEHADAATMATYVPVYRSYVRFADHQFGRMVADMKAAGTWDDALVVVTGDHGISFVPGRAGHAQGHLPESLARVPLLIKWPGRRPGRAVAGLTAHEDVVPTVLGAVYQAPPAGFVGVDLGRGDPPPDRRALAWAPFPKRLDARYAEAAAYEGRYKLLRTDDGRTALHDLAADPAATADVAAAAPGVAKRLEAWLHEQTGR